MSRPVTLHTCLAFCGLLLLNFAARCLAFPQTERSEIAYVPAEEGQFEKMNADDLENSSITSKQVPHMVVSEGPLPSAGPSAVPSSQVFLINKETPPGGAGLLPYAATAPAGPAGEDVFGSSQPERMSPEIRPFKAVFTTAVAATASLHSDGKEEGRRRTSMQPTAEGATEATLSHVDDQLFATESQEGVSLGHSSSSHVNAKEMLTAWLRPEESEASPDHRKTSFPGTGSTAGPEPESLTPDKEKLVQMTADDTQVTSTRQSFMTSEHTLSVQPETDSLLGAPQVTLSVSTAVSTAIVLSDEWDDTKLKSVGQIKTSKLGDSAGAQVRVEMSPTAQARHEGLEGGWPPTEAAHVALGLARGEAHMGTVLVTAQGDELSPAFTHQSSFPPTSLMEDTTVSVVNLFQSTGDFTESIKEKDAGSSLETTVSISEYESEAYQLLGNTSKDIITQEMTTAVQEPEATLSLVTQEQVALLEVTGDSGKTEAGEELPTPVSREPGVTQLSRKREPLATAVSTTAAPLSVEVTPAVEDLMDTVTGPGEELTPVLGSPVTPPGMTVETPHLSPMLPASEVSSEKGTVWPSISHVNTAASYGLDQLESEEGEEDEDEEDEEDEDEEEEDEEEDEEDKDGDSLGEGLDGAAELLGFTLPGVTSQEPDTEQGSVGLLEGATYQVPDAIEWEQQNQGLVRSWMEKLKDKAGYVSGMLVPVGVGIAGALFILGALYSIKAMNRRRRNGFKRHKRKQREFNSMQDRVMLLADSSEDEF
ncbi:armadillo-like helical domain-containing protein 4 [Nycticebus coucang]|uniref:armadillo-like helical domain-containing protein 4 n=1 Tax=Nycticebus coucang TaxID=9470 RepID=UPI00234C9685|nr:armadillo-like helical domain-containing protein 4 [Nycticebus coucang]XP_053459537.1 armadillo-like helical domain-containing protein 4 [Nycticebus coucang]XP_053459538.1 armadillo-like helical domain-containing protein 4 [Nycticebus coucang]